MLIILKLHQNKLLNLKKKKGLRVTNPSSEAHGSRLILLKCTPCNRKAQRKSKRKTFKDMMATMSQLRWRCKFIHRRGSVNPQRGQIRRKLYQATTHLNCWRPETKIQPQRQKKMVLSNGQAVALMTLVPSRKEQVLRQGNHV